MDGADPIDPAKRSPAGAALAEHAAGAPRRHESAAQHVTGAAVYADDAPEPKNLVHLAFGMAPIARGTVTEADLSAVRAAPGVVAVLTGDDVPGLNDVGPVAKDEPLLALVGGRAAVRFHGQPLFLVVADSFQAARAAARRAILTTDEETPILTIADAMAAGETVSPPYRMAKGDAAAALAASPRRLSGRMAIGGQEHFYLEGQVAVAAPGEDDEMRVLSSNQHPSECQLLVAQVLGVPSHAVTVEVRRLGGGFGGKETQGNALAAAAALAARITGRPAKMRLDRDDDFVLTGKRHEFEIDYEVGFDGDGRLLALRVEHRARCGWSLDLSKAICDRAMFHADNCYDIPAVEITSHRLRTNTASNTAFRGFGGPQGMLGMERIIQHVAAELAAEPAAEPAIDAAEIRRRNFYPPAGAAKLGTTPYHMTVEDFVADQLVEAVCESCGYAARRAEIRAWNADQPVLKRGLAVTPVRFGISFTTTHLNQAGALVLIYQDGSVLLNHGGVEMGQGLFTKVAQVAAAELNIDLSRIKVSATRTDKVPNTSATAASSGSDLNGMAVKDACAQLKARLAGVAAEKAGVAPSAVAFEPNRIRAGETVFSFDDVVKAAYLARVSLAASGFYATPKIHWDADAAQGRPFYYFAYGAAVCEAAIDTLTGENRILRADILHDVGRSLNPALDLGQVEGGFIQGLGWLTTEELVWDAAGALKTHAPSTYKIPTAGDRPPHMTVALWADGENRELTIRRSKAVGEPPLMLAMAGFFAIEDAVRAAGDGRYPALDAPATPERVLTAVQRVRA